MIFHWGPCGSSVSPNGFAGLAFVLPGQDLVVDRGRQLRVVVIIAYVEGKLTDQPAPRQNLAKLAKFP